MLSCVGAISGRLIAILYFELLAMALVPDSVFLSCAGAISCRLILILYFVLAMASEPDSICIELRCGDITRRYEWQFGSGILKGCHGMCNTHCLVVQENIAGIGVFIQARKKTFFLHQFLAFTKPNPPLCC